MGSHFVNGFTRQPHTGEQFDVQDLVPEIERLIWAKEIIARGRIDEDVHASDRVAREGEEFVRAAGLAEIKNRSKGFTAPSDNGANGVVRTLPIAIADDEFGAGPRQHFRTCPSTAAAAAAGHDRAFAGKALLVHGHRSLL